MFTAFQSDAFQQNAFQVGAEGVSAFPTFNVSGSGRRWYIIREKRLYLTNEELAWYVARELIDVSRQDIKVTYKTKAPRVIAANAYNSLLAAVKSLDIQFPGRSIVDIESDNESDDEEAILLLM